jgi:Ca2+-binding EF-hand superfamily protein
MKTLTTLSVAILLSFTTQVTLARPHHNAQNSTMPQSEQTRQDHHQARVTEILSRFDLNQDGQIGLDEVQSIHGDEFAKLDLDSNGLISFAEFQQAAPRHGGMGKGGMGKGGRGHHPPAMNGCPTAATTTTDTTTDTTTTRCQPPADRAQHQQAHFTRLDTDGDGQVSKAEFVANLPLFDRHDCDENGVITQTELLNPSCTTTTTTQ